MRHQPVSVRCDWHEGSADMIQELTSTRQLLSLHPHLHLHMLPRVQSVKRENRIQRHPQFFDEEPVVKIWFNEAEPLESARVQKGYLLLASEWSIRRRLGARYRPLIEEFEQSTLPHLLRRLVLADRPLPESPTRRAEKESLEFHFGPSEF